MKRPTDYKFHEPTSLDSLDVPEIGLEQVDDFLFSVNEARLTRAPSFGAVVLREVGDEVAAGITRQQWQYQTEHAELQETPFATIGKGLHEDKSDTNTLTVISALSGESDFLALCDIDEVFVNERLRTISPAPSIFISQNILEDDVFYGPRPKLTQRTRLHPGDVVLQDSSQHHILGNFSSDRLSLSRYYIDVQLPPLAHAVKAALDDPTPDRWR